MVQPLTKLPPQAIEIEESIISSCLLGCYEDALEILTPDDFYRTAHNKIFAAVVESAKKFGSVDATTVCSILLDRGEIEECGGITGVSKFIDIVPSSVSPRHHCEIIKSKSILRKIIDKASGITVKAFSGEGAEEVIDFAQTELMSIEMNRAGDKGEQISSIISGTVETIEKRATQKKVVTGVPSGFKRLDMMTAGWQKGDFIILGARPSMGKTALAWQLAKHAAQAGTPTLVLELEMTKDQLGMRSLSNEARVDFSRLRIGRLDSHEWGKIADASEVISKLSIIIDDQPTISILDARRKTMKAIKSSGCGLVILDYLQLMKVAGRNRENEIGAISRELKGLAKDLDLPVIALSQLNRKLEERSDKHPILSDLRDSGSLEQDADVVMFVYRDEVYNKEENNPLRGTAEIILAKQRSGPVGMVPLTFLGKYMSFENPA